MGKLLSPALYLSMWGEETGRVLMFDCPGCKCIHAVHIDKPNIKGATWTWNEDPVKFSFHPSIDVNRDDPKSRCHSFVKDGMIQFLSDCYHELKNQTVPIPDWD